MKKMMSRAGLGAVAITVLMSSCVSKRKYMDAQATIEKYRSDSAQWAGQMNSMQQNVSGLEQKNRSLQQQWDSSQNQWKHQQQQLQSYQTYYDQQKTGTEELHQRVHQALDNSGVVSKEDIVAHNGKVYITLDDASLWSGSNLSSKGKQAIAKLAAAVKDNDNVVVTIASSNSYAAYWGGTAASGMDAGRGDEMNRDADKDMSKNKNMDKQHMDKSDKNKDMDKSDMTKSDKAKKDNQGKANIGDSAYVGSGGDKGTAKANKATAQKSHKGVAKTHKTGKEGGEGEMVSRPTTKKSSSAKSSTASWSSNMNKATALAKELSNQGVSQISLVAPAQGSTASTNTGMGKSSGFQLILSTRSSDMNPMWQQGSAPAQGSTGMR